MSALAIATKGIICCRRPTDGGPGGGGVIRRTSEMSKKECEARYFPKVKIDFVKCDEYPDISVSTKLLSVVDKL